MELYTDPDGVNLYFSAQTNDGSQGNYLSAPIDWATNRWHLLALTYGSTNSALYVDGELVTNGLPVTYWPGPDVLANGFYIGSASDGTAQAQGMIDSLSTYATPLDAGTIYDTFWFGLVPYDLNPYNSANISSAPYTPASTPTFVAITGPGYLLPVATNPSDCVTSSNVWLTNVVATVATQRDAEPGVHHRGGFEFAGVRCVRHGGAANPDHQRAVGLDGTRLPVQPVAC